MADWQALPQSRNVVDHRGTDWRIRNAILTDLSPDEVAGDDLGPHLNALLARLQSRRNPPPAYQPRAYTADVRQQIADGRLNPMLRARW
jgi:hypothetical protein